MAHPMDEIRSIAIQIYGRQQGDAAFERLKALLDNYDAPIQEVQNRFSEKDVVLITYGNTLMGEGMSPLQALFSFAQKYLKESFSAIHFLPFYPFSSDDGFSVIDFLKVDPAVGTWQDIESFGNDFHLMFDYVLNHISAKSPWFESYLAGKPGYEELAVEASPESDLSAVTRPRALPLLTPFTKDNGDPVNLWTTFSDDQIDLNYKSLDVLVQMVEVLLFYVSKGARFIRMDAVAYLWKEIGTNCIHLPRTHAMVSLFRKILDLVAPEVVIITETNVPHDENISYFGDGYNEAQMVYNFTLPPLLLHTFNTGDSQELSQWAHTLNTPSEQSTFFNFTASHDGIGVRPLEGVLPPRKIDALTKLAVNNGGQVSYKHNSDGSKSPYELNLVYVNAMESHPTKFLASQAIQMVLPGVPAVYIHSLLGSQNWNEGVEKTGRARTINRQQLTMEQIMKDLGDSNSFRSKIFYPYCHMLKIRRGQSAFHPNAGFEVLQTDHRVFAIRRFSKTQEIFVLVNVGRDPINLSLGHKGISGPVKDLISGRVVEPDLIKLGSYQVLWLEPKTC